MDLTICIPHTSSRQSLLSRTLWSIEHSDVGASVEVLVHRGDGPMGDKLNEMFAAARGKYVVAVDDDDYLSLDFQCHMLPFAHYGEFDFIGYRIVVLHNGAYLMEVSHNPDHDPRCNWQTPNRGVSPKCLVRTEIARRHRFGNEYSDDLVWSKAVQADIRSHTFIDAPLYFYDYWLAHNLGTKPDHYPGREQRDVGMWPYDPEKVTWLS